MFLKKNSQLAKLINIWLITSDPVRMNIKK